MMKKLLNLAALKAYRPIRVNPADLERSAVLIPVIRDGAPPMRKHFVAHDVMFFLMRSKIESQL
jgi:hypothetical protein